MGPRTITSWEQLQADIAGILEKINDNQELALAAAVNPVYALEELGYEIDPDARSSIEDRLRFGQRDAEKLGELRSAIFQQAGHRLNINSPDELSKLLFDQLKISLPDDKSQHPGRKARSVYAPDLSYHWRPGGAGEDPLKILAGAHPIIEPLLTYRGIEASQPRLANRDLYKRVRQGKFRLPIQSLRGNLKKSGRKTRRRST